MRILEIGFVGGNLIPELTSTTQNIEYVGLDYSKSRVKEVKRY